MYDEDKLIDKIIEILRMMNSYVPTSVNPANPQLGLILQKVLALQAIRLASKAKFKLHFDNISQITKQISDIKI